MAEKEDLDLDVKPPSNKKLIIIMALVGVLLIAGSVGLTQAQARALLHLARNEGISQVALARLLEIQPITLLRQLDRLADAGLIERRPNPNDRRAQQLFLTPRAQPLLDQLWEAGDEILDEAYAGFSDEERATFIDMLVRMRGNLARFAQGESSARSRGAGFRKAS